MANLISWLGGGARRIANTVNNDVLQPINRDVYQPAVRAAPAPIRGAAQAIKQDVTSAVAPGYHAVVALNPLNESINAIKAGSGLLTGNPTAVHNAINPYLNIGRGIRGLAQGTAAQAVQLGESLNPIGGDVYKRQFTPSNPFQKAILGTNSIPSLQTAYKQNKQAGGKGYANTQAVVSALMDASGIYGTAKGAIEAQKRAQPLNDVGAIGKNVSPSLPSKSPKTPLTPEGVPIKEAGKGTNLNEGAFSKADIANLEKQIAKEQETHAVGDIPQPGFESMKSGIQKQLNPPLSQAERLKLGNPEKNPLYGKVRVPQAQDAAQAHFNADFVLNKEKTIGAKALQDLGKLSAKDQELMKQVQTKGVSVAGEAENLGQFKQALSSIRQYYDTRHAYDHYLGIKTPYRENYLRDLVQRNEGDAVPLSGGNQTPGYTRAKTQAGYSNVAEALQRDINGASFNHGKLVYTKGLDEVYPGQIQAGKPYTDATTQLSTPYGKELFAPKDLARQINERAPVPKATGLTGKYDSVNAFQKYLKLSGGGFHAFTETGNFIGQQIMSGKLFTEPTSTGKIFKVMFSDNAMRGEVAKLAENGTLDKANLGGLTWTPSEIKADVNVTPTGKIAKYTGIKALHDATFKRDIPYAKLKTFEQATQGLDVNNPADLEKIRAAAKGTNEAYGGINRMADGLTPKQAKVAARGVLATDFTEGKIRTVIAAISKGGLEGKIARQLIAGKVLLFAGLATAGGALAGEYKGKDTKQIAENILGNFVNPTFKAGGSIVSFPATHVSEFGKPLTPLFKNSQNRFSGIDTYAKDRLAALPSEALQLKTNLDFQGQHIYGKETKKSGGAPISPTKTAVNIAGGVLPIPISQGIVTGQGKQGLPATAANIIGLKVRPDTTPAPNTPEANKQTGTQEYNQYKNKPPQGYDLRGLSDGTYAYTIDGKPHQTTKLKTAQQAIARDAFGNSDQNIKIVGNTVLRKSASGNVSITPKIKYDYSLNSATLTQQKKAGNLQAYYSTAQKQLQNIQTQLKDPDTDPLDKLTLQNEAQTLVDNMSKYQGYGGFTKPKAPKLPSAASFKTASQFKAPKIKGIKVRVPKANFKAPKTRKIAVSRIPSNYLSKRLA